MNYCIVKYTHTNNIMNKTTKFIQYLSISNVPYIITVHM